jgi:hypothetical protein
MASSSKSSKMQQPRKFLRKLLKNRIFIAFAVLALILTSTYVVYFIILDRSASIARLTIEEMEEVEERHLVLTFKAWLGDINITAVTAVVDDSLFQPVYFGPHPADINQNKSFSVPVIDLGVEQQVAFWTNDSFPRGEILFSIRYKIDNHWVRFLELKFELI